MNGGGVYLKTYLAPLSPWLDRSDITDIMVNRPGEVWTESASGMERTKAPAITEIMLERLAQQIAASSSQGVSREHPLLAATLPDGARVQLAGPPATRGPIALSIRKHVVPDLTLEDYEAAGAFRRADPTRQPSRSDVDARLDELLDAGNLREFFALAVKARRNIVISGGTASGKTTFLNALLKETPNTDRIIVIEDTAEVTLTQPNSVGLVAVKSELGESQVGVDDLLRASLRMRPDRLLVGEIRGGEAFTFLRAVNTGHPGSFTTVHADSPEGALEQIAFMSLQSGLNLNRSDIRDYARSVLDIVVQLTRIDGRRVVERVLFNRRQ